MTSQVWTAGASILHVWWVSSTKKAFTCMTCHSKTTQASSPMFYAEGWSMENIGGIKIHKFEPNISDLEDVDVSDPANGDLLVYNETNEIFENVHLKTVNGEGLLGNGDLALPGTLYYGETTTVSEISVKVVTLIKPTGVVFPNGGVLRLKYYRAVAANQQGTTLSLGENTYALGWNGALLTSADIIKAGDYVTLYCYNAFAWIMCIDRWGAEIEGKQDKLPSLSGNAGKVLAVNSNESGMGWIEPGYSYFSHTIPADQIDPVTLTCTSKSHHHVTMLPDSMNLIVDVRNNFENLITVDFTVPRTSGNSPMLVIDIKKNGVNVTRTLCNIGGVANVISDGHIFCPLDATPNNDVNHLYIKVSTAIAGSYTYGIVHQTPMLIWTQTNQ